MADDGHGTSLALCSAVATPVAAVVDLVALGADDARLDEAAAIGGGELGRVLRLDRGMATVGTAAGVVRIDTTGPSPVVVGDWVVVRDGTCTRLERRTELVRRFGYRRDQRQAMAANVDLVVVVRALDTELRVGRIAQLLVVAHDSGADAVVLLTKADVVDDLDAVLATARAGLSGETVLGVSATTGLGVEDVAAMVRGRSVVILGESGAGKSTLTNLLLGEVHLDTAAVRRDGQGRHTTTHRELVVLPGGGVLIDTPGIREVATMGEGDGVDRAFADLADLATTCRFSDCAHRTTPGCALTAAIEAGTVDADRVERYLAELGRQATFDRRVEERARRPKGRPAPRQRGD